MVRLCSRWKGNGFLISDHLHYKCVHQMNSDYFKAYDACRRLFFTSKQLPWKINTCHLWHRSIAMKRTTREILVSIKRTKKCIYNQLKHAVSLMKSLFFLTKLLRSSFLLADLANAFEIVQLHGILRESFSRAKFIVLRYAW